MNQKKIYANVPKVDLVGPFHIGNFLHKRSLICIDLFEEAQTLLYELGWKDEFSMYYHIDNTSKIRLYFKITYVSNVHIDGYWNDLKTKLREIVPLIKSFKELRLHANFVTANWIETHTKEIDWVQEDYVRYKLLQKR